MMYDDELNEIVKAALLKKYEQIEERIKKTKPKNTWVHQYVWRKIKTEFGLIRLKIARYYVLKNNKKITFYFSEQLIFFRQNNNICEDLKRKIFEFSQLGMSYRNIQKALNSTISISTISKINQNFRLNNNLENNEKTNYLSLVKAIKPKNIYLEIDDSYQKMREFRGVKKYRNRMIIIHLGYDKNKKIIGKTVICESKKINDYHLNNYGFKTQIERIIKQKYGLDITKKQINLVVIGDGARWIKSLAKLLNANYLLDLFHIKLKAFKVFGFGKYQTKNKKLFAKYTNNGTSFYKKILSLIETNNALKAIKLLTDFMISAENGLLNKVKKKEIWEFIKYLRANLIGLNHFNKYWNIGSRTESFVSHLIKKNTTKKFGIFGQNTFFNKLLATQNSNLSYVFII